MKNCTEFHCISKFALVEFAVYLIFTHLEKKVIQTQLFLLNLYNTACA